MIKETKSGKVGVMKTNREGSQILTVSNLFETVYGEVRPGFNGLNYYVRKDGKILVPSTRCVSFNEGLSAILSALDNG